MLPLQRLTRQAHGDDSFFAEREYDMHVSVADQDRRITVDAVFVQTDHLAFVLGIIQQKMLIPSSERERARTWRVRGGKGSGVPT